MNDNDLISELTDKVNEGYSTLAKWLISLSSGIIVFSINLINNKDTPEILNNLLILGLGLLVLSILLGVFYVRFGIDCLHYNLMCIGIEKELVKLESISDLEKKKRLKDQLNKTYKTQNRRFERMNKIMPFVIPLLTWSFIFGVILIVLFAYGYINL